MNAGLLFLIIGLAGCLGGLANCLIAKEFVSMGRDKDSGVWRPGWLGNVLVGAIAAFVVWCVYGPLAASDVFAAFSVQPHLTFFQFGSSVVVGLGGGSLLTKMAQAQAESAAKSALVDSLKSLTSKGPSREDNFIGLPTANKQVETLLANLKTSDPFESASIAAQISKTLA